MTQTVMTVELDYPLVVPRTEGKPFRFVSGKNKGTGQIGWKPAAFPTFDPSSPVMVAHDLMEHFPEAAEGVHNEYLAQGALLWLRLEGGFWGEWTNTSFDLRTMMNNVVPKAYGMLFYTIVTRDLDTRPAPLALPSMAPLVARTEMALVSLLGECERRLRSRSNGQFEQDRVNNMTLAEADRCRESLTHAAGWMRIGYRLAELRYAGLDKRRLVRLFQNMVTAIEKTLDVEKILRKDDDYTDRELVLTAYPSDYTFRLAYNILGRGDVEGNVAGDDRGDDEGSADE